MKIGYILQEGVPDIRKKPPSGAANHVIQVIRELQNAGHQVTVLIRFDHQIWRSEDLKNFSPVYIQRMDQGLIRFIEKAIRRIQHEFKFAYANFFESVRFAYACCQELSDCDVYFERMGWMGYGGGLAARWQNIPLVLEVNGDHLDEFKSQGLHINKVQLMLSTWLMNKATQRVQYVVTTGEGWKQKFIERWGVDSSIISVVENGTELVDILKRNELKALSEEAIIQDKISLAYCGGFEPWHGVLILIEAVHKALELGTKLQVTLIGSGSMLKQIEDKIEELELKSIFTLTGQVSIEELSKLLAQSNIGVSPYCGREEFSGLKLLDYKAAGLAIIASGTNNQPAVIDHGRTGWIVPPCDNDALSQAIFFLAKNHRLRINIGLEARLEAEKIHKWQHTTEQLIKIFELVTNN